MSSIAIETRQLRTRSCQNVVTSGPNYEFRTKVAQNCGELGMVEMYQKNSWTVECNRRFCSSFVSGIS